METKKPISITIEVIVSVPIEKVWQAWNDPDHIKQWNHASDDWYAPHSEVDLRIGGEFKCTMAAKDGSMSFDYGGIYTNIIEHQLIEQTLGDGRKVKTVFSFQNGKTKVVETFDAETENSIEMQRGGWQAILDNFKKHVENNK